MALIIKLYACLLYRIHQTNVLKIPITQKKRMLGENKTKKKYDDGHFYIWVHKVMKFYDRNITCYSENKYYMQSEPLIEWKKKKHKLEINVYRAVSNLRNYTSSLN